MANEQRVRFNSYSGTITDNPLLIGATTMTSAELANFPAVTSAQHVPITLDPQGVGGRPEVVYITAHTASATTATILRGQEQVFGSSAARQHNVNTRWSHGPTAFDLTYPKSPTTRVVARANFK